MGEPGNGLTQLTVKVLTHTLRQCSPQKSYLHKSKDSMFIYYYCEVTVTHIYI